MRHRIGLASWIGLGNPAPEMLDNQWTGDKKRDALIKQMLKAAISLYFKEEGGVDFTIDKNFIRLGIEPAYKYEYLKIICISWKREFSYIENGVAWGAWGSQIASTKKKYMDYKNRGKFVKFIDEWQPKLFS